MKYFIKINDTTYAIDKDTAYKVYIDLAGSGIIDGSDITEMFIKGLSAGPRRGTTRIYGEEMSDGQLFKLILAGKIHKGLANNA